MPDADVKNEVLWEVLLETRRQLAEQKQETEMLRLRLQKYGQLRNKLFDPLHLAEEPALDALLAPGVVSVPDLLVQHAARRQEQGLLGDEELEPHPLALPGLDFALGTPRTLDFDFAKTLERFDKPPASDAGPLVTG